MLVMYYSREVDNYSSRYNTFEYKENLLIDKLLDDEFDFKEYFKRKYKHMKSFN